MQNGQLRKQRTLLALGVGMALIVGACGGDSNDDAHPPPTAAQLRNITPLTEGWRFVQDDRLTDDQALANSGENWNQVSVPHTWNATDAATTAQSTPSTPDYKRGLGWYRLEFNNAGNSGATWLQFDAASIYADVWLNGVKLGRHAGAFTAFRFDVTSVLRPGTNVLLVKTDNRNSGASAIAPISGDFNMAGGLYRKVSLIGTQATAHVALDDFASTGVFARTTTIGTSSATVNVVTKLRNGASTPGTFTVTTSLLDPDGKVKASVTGGVIALEAGATAAPAQDVVVDRPRLWQGVSDPYLYTMVVELKNASGAAVDKVVQQFGIRQMRVDPNLGFFLNGRSVPLRGVNLHQDMLGKAWAISEADVDQSFAIIKEVGANTVRLAHYPHSDYTVAQADKLGLVVWAELPVVNSTAPSGVDPETTGFAANARLQLQELIRQQFNHPSIAFWSIANEVQGGTATTNNVIPLLQNLHALAKQEDPQRITTLAHQITRSGDVILPPTLPQTGVTDTYGVNRYFQWYYGTSETQFGEDLDQLHADNPTIPIGVGEYGAGNAITHHSDNVFGGRVCSRDTSGSTRICYQAEEYANYVHERDYAQIAARPYLMGTWIWNMFDFGSGVRHEGDLGLTNTKGIVTFGRDVKKDVFYYYKANWSTAPVTYITSRRYVNRAYAVTNLKVYSNADTVTLRVNDVPVGTRSATECPLRVCEFNNVQLAAGNNVVSATGRHGSTTVNDLVNWNLNASLIDNVFIAAGQLHTGFTSQGDPLLGNRVFGSDNFFVGGGLPPVTGGLANIIGLSGRVIITGIGTAGTTIPETGRVWDMWRHGAAFSYRIPVPDGNYRVTLGFLEPTATAVGQRLFNVSANGVLQIADLDIFQVTGARNSAIARSFNVAVTNGLLSLDFAGTTGNATVSNISVVRQ